MNSTVRYNVMLEESEIFEKWKDFVENLTVDWLIENYRGTTRMRRVDRYVYTYDHVFIIFWNDITLYFNPPTWPSSDKLSIKGDSELFKYVPIDVMNDFVRVIEL